MHHQLPLEQRPCEQGHDVDNTQRPYLRAIAQLNRLVQCCALLWHAGGVLPRALLQLRVASGSPFGLEAVRVHEAEHVLIKDRIARAARLDLFATKIC